MTNSSNPNEGLGATLVRAANRVDGTEGRRTLF